jgi:hypothetical protein
MKEDKNGELCGTYGSVWQCFAGVTLKEKRLLEKI